MGKRGCLVPLPLPYDPGICGLCQASVGTEHHIISYHSFWKQVDPYLTRIDSLIHLYQIYRYSKPAIACPGPFAQLMHTWHSLGPSKFAQQAHTPETRFQANEILFLGISPPAQNYTLRDV